MSCFTDHVPPLDRRIVRAILTEAFTRGYSVSVYDGDEWTVKRSANMNEVTDALATTDEDAVRFRDGDRVVGTMSLVYGNEPGVIVADYTDNPDMVSLIEPITRRLAA